MSVETIIEEDQVEEQEKTKSKKNKQSFHRAIKRDYQRHNFYQKTR